MKIVSSFYKALTRFLDTDLHVQFRSRTYQEAMSVNKNTKYLLVIGLSRSGTSLLQKLLNSIDGVFVSYESIYQPMFSDYSKEVTNSLYYELLRQHGHLVGQDTSLIYKYFGDKMIFQNTRSYRRALKKAIDLKVDKVIFIVRDPRDRWLSLQSWNEKRNNTLLNTTNTKLSLEQESHRWNSFVDQGTSSINRSNKSIMIKYEELVDPSSNCFSSILEHLEIAEDTSTNTLYKEKVNSFSVNKWKTNLDNKLNQQILSECDKNLRLLNYM